MRSHGTLRWTETELECGPLRGESGWLVEERAEVSDTQASWQREG